MGDNQDLELASEVGGRLVGLSPYTVGSDAISGQIVSESSGIAGYQSVSAEN